MNNDKIPVLTATVSLTSTIVKWMHRSPIVRVIILCYLAAILVFFSIPSFGHDFVYRTIYNITFNSFIYDTQIHMEQLP